jgi:hypothetical protein
LPGSLGWNNGRVLARAAVALIAVAAIGWLAVMERDARLYDRGLAAGGGLDDPRTIAQAEADLREARLLNPDRTPDVARALVLFTTGRQDRAQALIEDVLRAEPDNLSAWGALGYANSGKDPAVDERVRRQVRRLDPLRREDPSPRGR